MAALVKEFPLVVTLLYFINTEEELGSKLLIATMVERRYKRAAVEQQRLKLYQQKRKSLKAKVTELNILRLTSVFFGSTQNKRIMSTKTLQNKKRWYTNKTQKKNQIYMYTNKSEKNVNLFIIDFTHSPRVNKCICWLYIINVSSPALLPLHYLSCPLWLLKCSLWCRLLIVRAVGTITLHTVWTFCHYLSP